MRIRLSHILVVLFLSLALSCAKEEIVSYEGESVVPGDVYVASIDNDSTINVQRFGVLPTNTSADNKTNLQKAIDWASSSGAALYLPPSKDGYPMDGGLYLRKNVTIFGAQCSSGNINSSGDAPAGSVFVIRDRRKPFIRLESASRLTGLQFFYPEQTCSDPGKIIEYPPTLALSLSQSSQGVTLTDLNFYGDYVTMDFLCSSSIPCEQILIENCKAYPLSGEFVKISYCYDIPRVLHCSVDPDIGSSFGKSMSKSILDHVAGSGNYSYWFDCIDNLVLMDISASCVFGGLYLGSSTYGQLTGFSFDCVNRGIHRLGNNSKNRTWLISEGFINANIGNDASDIHPIIIDGFGYSSLTNVTASAKENDSLTTKGVSFDFVDIVGSNGLNVGLTNCCMMGYEADFPITVNNSYAKVRALSCVDRNGDLFDYVY